ncbi:MAG: carboxypeptidase-like regulatory domain-containing protein [Bacteroidia bacterium]|nr:carboxypeptidase-like regulatory domain-containing protein [Bacteroidia bacterium]
MKLSIPTPCSQSWQQMETAGNNRFCNSCKKNVIDFTTKSEKEIIDYLKNNSEKVCGKFLPSQLNIELVSSYKTPFRFKHAASVLLATFTFSGISYAQQPQKKDENGIVEKKKGTNTIEEKIEGPITISGTVVDKNTKNPIPFAIILLAGTETHIASDIDGKFKLPLNSGSSGSFSMRFVYVGYRTKEIINITIPHNENEINLENIELEEADNLDVVGLLIADKPKKNLFKRIFSRKK